MSKIPEELKYTKTHEWVKIDGEIATIGITDHAQHELSDVVFLELPNKGRQVNAGEACAVVESHKTASDVYSPLSGEVVDSNLELLNDLSLINTDPYGKGWFFKLKISNHKEIENLLSAKDYKKIING
ncbi:MAG: glycine cleavage system protein GcvH [Verrucomicrobiia bacterium]